jgi:hypothetical protein
MFLPGSWSERDDFGIASFSWKRVRRKEIMNKKGFGTMRKNSLQAGLA